MKRILVVSKFWKEYDKSGMGFSSSKHYQILLDCGYDVKRIVTKEISSPDDGSHDFFYIKSEGAGSLYSSVVVDEKKLGNVIKKVNPDLIFVEAWQTGLSEKTINLAYDQKIPVVMISHGISILPYNFSLKSFLRTLLWIPYALSTFPRTLNKLTAITALSKQGNSFRLIDRDCAKLFKKEIYLLSNLPVNHGRLRSYAGRKRQILCIGYFSFVKNQIKALKVLKMLPTDFEMVFVGDKEGAYYKKTIAFIDQNNLWDRVKIYQDKEVKLSELYEQVLVVMSSSITEVLSLVLLESMATGTPFVATNVGVNSQLSGGLISNSNREMADFILQLADSESFWNIYSKRCLDEVNMKHSNDIITKQMNDLVESVLSIDKG